MILIDAGERSERAFDAKLIFAAQLAARGYRVGIDERTIPDTLERPQKFEMARFLVDAQDVAISRYLMIGAEHVSDETLMTLRSYGLEPRSAVSAVGRFPDRQAIIGSRSRIAYVLGREPEIVDLCDFQKKPLLPSAISPLSASAVHSRRNDRKTPELFLFLPPETLEDPLTPPTLAVLDSLRAFRLNLLVSGGGKDQTRTARQTHLRSFKISELSPVTFAQMADVAVFLGDDIHAERIAAFALNMMEPGKVVVDCTAAEALVSCGAPALRGPQELAALPAYLEQTVLTNVEEIGHFLQKSAWLGNHGIARLEKALGLAPPQARLATAATPENRTIFVPTNGVGLGHAQRCTLIAAAMQRPEDVAFAAFPSCVPLVQAKGFPCLPLVPKSPYHAEPFANDIVNYLRLHRAVGVGDRLVFDGSYVFDSIFRLILEKDLSAIWVRRGLWQAGAFKAEYLERGKAFAKVIVPSEAFEELNTDYGHRDHTHLVGPIVQGVPEDAGDQPKLRKQLQSRFGHAFGELVVTMLGGGVAADRSAQITTLCNIFERRKNCLHLIVVWPGSKVPSSAYGWKNTRVVQTGNALSLCRAADLVTSAVGYNSFHEILYHQIPSILVPQMAPYMDDQERRARAASERGLAETVLATQLFQLEREVKAFLDEGKAGQIRKNLASAMLPLRGNVAAAGLIEERCRT